MLISLSNKESTKEQVLLIGRTLSELGFTLIVTKGTADFYNTNGIVCQTINKIGAGRPDVADLIMNKEVKLVINTQRQNAIITKTARQSANFA